MGIRDIGPENFVAPYQRPRFGSGEAEEAWKQRNAKRREKQTVLAVVAEGCSVETVRGTTLRDGEEVTLGDVGGGVNLDRLASVGAVNKVDENTVKRNRGEYEFTALRSFTHNGKVYDVGEGFNAEQLDRPAEDPEPTVDPNTGKLRKGKGLTAVDGAALAEALIKGQLAKRAELRKRVAKAVKARLAKAKEAESEA
jgi:hypothetical protein